MALSHELPIYRDTYKLILGLFELTQHFSKEYKYSLGQDKTRCYLFGTQHIQSKQKPAKERAYRRVFR